MHFAGRRCLILTYYIFKLKNVYRTICPLLSAVFARSTSQLRSLARAALNMNIEDDLEELLHQRDTLVHQLNLPINTLKREIFQTLNSRIKCFKCKVVWQSLENDKLLLFLQNMQSPAPHCKTNF